MRSRSCTADRHWKLAQWDQHTVDDRTLDPFCESQGSGLGCLGLGGLPAFFGLYGFIPQATNERFVQRRGFVLGFFSDAPTPILKPKKP